MPRVRSIMAVATVIAAGTPSDHHLASDPCSTTSILTTSY